MVTLKINGTQYTLDVEPEMPLLWALRDELGLTGTKFGCGVASCGACTVQVNGNPVRSCVMPVSAVEGQEITTIEGLAESSLAHYEPGDLNAVQTAWIDHQVPQCGYCQSGQIMQAVSFLRTNPNPTDEEIESAMRGNLCRCMTYPRVNKAIRSVVDNADITEV